MILIEWVVGMQGHAVSFLKGCELWYGVLFDLDAWMLPRHVQSLDLNKSTR